MAKCGYGKESTKANEKDCVGCYYLLSLADPKVACDWRESDGADELKGPTSYPEPLESYEKKEKASL